MVHSAFMKYLGAISLLNTLQLPSPTLPNSQISNIEIDSLLSRVRIIVVGSGGWSWIEENFFCANREPTLCLEAENILFIGRTGRLFKAPRQEDQDPLWWDFHSEGEGCERDLSRIADFKNSLMGVRTEIAHFVQSSDWAVLVASLDNGIAFAACDEVAELCRSLGVGVMGLVATPYYGVPADRSRCERLARASDLVINNMIDNGHPVIRDEGYWEESENHSSKWHCGYMDNALWMSCNVNMGNIPDAFSKMFERSPRLKYASGLGSSASEAIQEAIDVDSWPGTNLDSKLSISGGAVIRVSGHPDMLEILRAEVMAELQMPEQFKSNEHPYWRKDAQFIVTVEPNEHKNPDKFFYVDVLTVGLEVV